MKRHMFFVAMAMFKFVSSQVVLQAPLSGTINKDYFIINHLDHNPTSAIKEFKCGSWTYDGHQGTDFILRNFRQMDSGVYVLAAAPGLVHAFSDTAFDRRKTAIPALTYGNFVELYHADSVVTVYAHLRKGSVKVTVGQLVNAGDTLGFVASSGYASDPHLHFELWRNYKNLDPFSGPCGTAYNWWIQPPSYDTSYRFIDCGLINKPGVLDSLKERPDDMKSLSAQSNSIVTFWVHDVGINKGDSVTLKWHSLKTGALWFQKTYHYSFASHYNYYWDYIYNPILYNGEGEFLVEYYVNGVHKASKKFSVLTTGLGETSGLMQKVGGMYDPHNQSLQIFADQNLEEASLTVYAETGQKLAERRISRISENKYVINIQLAPGLYTIAICTDNRITCVRIPVQQN